MSTVYSYSNRTIAISTTAQNADLDDHEDTGFPSLTYTAIGKIGSIGPYGVDTNVISYDTLDNDVISKAKGQTNAGDVAVEMARVDADAGQILMKAAGASANKNNYAFKVTNQDGSIDYLRGLVMGPVSTGGRTEDFDLYTYTIGLQQEFVHVAAP